MCKDKTYYRKLGKNVLNKIRKQIMFYSFMNNSFPPNFKNSTF